MATKKERAVVVTTQHKGVFFGYATETEDPAAPPVKVPPTKEKPGK